MWGYHWIKDVLKLKMFLLEKTYIDDNGIDMLTKVLTQG